MHEGSTVRYAGLQQDELTPGTRGRVLSHTALYGHVRWLEGPSQGQVGLYPIEDLQGLSGPSRTAGVDSLHESLNDSLEVGSLVSIASAREAYDGEGLPGLLAHLVSTDHLNIYASCVEDALTQVMTSLTDDPLLHRLTAHMDEDEAQQLYRTAARQLLLDQM